tara:strand:- start:403 stop:801 length:399 start_codon:yes stop_codon:yes gene_type:complete
MGRYYQGDIEGKFWFAVQPTDDADFFGVTGYQPERLEYSFYEDDESGVRDGLEKCLKELGDAKPHLDKFFEINSTYNNEQLREYLNEHTHPFRFTEEGVNHLLKWYARHRLGSKILGSITEHGQCVFEAECG